MTLDKNQICTTCGRDWRGEDAEDVLPGCRCPHEECPSNVVTPQNARAGMTCCDRTDCSTVRLRSPVEGDAWEWIVDTARLGDLWLLDLPRGVAE